MTQSNRGKESSDDKLFGAEKMQMRLREAVEDLSHLMSRGYAQRSALSLVGNRYKLNVRQQKALQGMAASAHQVRHRNACSLSASELEGREMVLDGFNVLILLESLLSDAYVFKGADGFYRDLSSVHGSYRKVQQTTRAIELVGEFYTSKKIQSMHWYFDKPVSNSGKLKKIIEDFAAENGFRWKVSLTFQTDADIVSEQKPVISSDAWILDHSSENFNLVKYIAERHASANIVDLKVHLF